MDPFEMLIRASAIDESNNTIINNSNNNNTINFDYRNYLKDPMLGPIDSIMMLAEQASQKSPIHKGGGSGNQEEDAHFNIVNGSFERRKSRAMSEPWMQSETWSADRAKSFLSLGSSSSSSSSSSFSSSSSSISAMKRSGREGNIEFTASSALSSSSSSLSNVRYNHLRSGTMSSVDLLHQYSDIYNKFGRVGIYTKDERNAIISRFREKKKTRIWKKKIRYTCRKSLADRRVRVKGRFVKMPARSGMSDERVKGEGKNGNNSSNSSNGDGRTQLMVLLPCRSGDRGNGGEIRPSMYRAKEEGDEDEDDYMEGEEEEGEYRDDIINGNVDVDYDDVDDDDDDGYLELIDDNAASVALSLLSGSKELVFGTDLDHADDNDDDDDNRYGSHCDVVGSGTVSNSLSSSSSSISPSSSMQLSQPNCTNSSSNNRYHNDNIHTTTTAGRNGYRNNNTTRKAIVVEAKGLITPPSSSSCDHHDAAEVTTIAISTTLPPPPQRKKVEQDIVVRSKRIRRHSIAY